MTTLAAIFGSRGYKFPAYQRYESELRLTYNAGQSLR